MNVSVPSVLPRSTLTPLALQHKFLSAKLRGLGECIEWDETGACIADDGGSVPVISGGQCPGDPGCPGYVPPSSGGGAIPDDGGSLWLIPGSTVTTAYPDASGNIIVPNGAGGYSVISAGGQVQNYPASAARPPAGSGSTITASQAQMYASLINSLTSAGVHIATITSLPAGASLLPNGTIVGAGQHAGPGGVLNPSLGTLLSNPMVLIGGFVALLLAMEAR